MDVQLDLSMRTAGVLEGWSLRDYHAEYKCVLNSLSDGLEARLIDSDRWYKDNQYLYYRRHDLMVAYSGPITAQGTQGATSLLTFSASVSNAH